MIYRENGQLFYKSDYKKGKREGSFESYHRNGKLFYKGSYKNDEKDGSWETFFEDGTVFEEFTGTFTNGVKVSD